MTGLPLVIDCDPGIDDAVAIALAVASPEVDLIAVTTVGGNAPVARTTRNARSVLHLLDAAHVPVAKGGECRHAAYPTDRPPGAIHGTNGLGGVELTEPTSPLNTDHAVDYLAALLRRHDQRAVTIAALGPLTNIALLAERYPEALHHIRRVVVMGGSCGPGNVSPNAEFNIWFDPEAAQQVLTDPRLAVCLVGLDVTRRACIDEADLAAWRTRSDHGACLADMVRGYRDHGPDGWSMHDVLVLAAVIDPGVITTRRTQLAVDISGGPHRGQTFRVSTNAATGMSPAAKRDIPCLVDLAVDVDVSRFRELVRGRVGRPASGVDARAEAGSTK